MEMPAPDQAVIARRDAIAAALRQIVPGEGVILSEPERRAYESDGLTAYHQSPLIVVLPSTLAEVAAVLRYCKAAGIKVVPRGPASPISASPMPSRTPGFITRPTRRARSPARSAAMSRRIRAACIASNT